MTANAATHPSLSDPRVAAARAATHAGSPGYAPAPADGAPEPLAGAVASVAGALGWSSPERGAFGALVPEGARVLVKPNWVTHRNQAPFGTDPLVTHPSVIRAVVRALLESAAGEVLVGDAPIQGCDFDQLVGDAGLAAWAEGVAAADPRFGGLRDFRRTKLTRKGAVREQARDQRPMDQFVLFDLGESSLLEPITQDDRSFRVTVYPPALMRNTHAPGRHQYLVAREVIDADVIVNLPKLKTHKKAGVTCALKNLIGINGNKEFLPHHRVGGAEVGGDCYPGRSVVKRTLEHVLDVQNTVEAPAAQRVLDVASRALYKVAHLQGDQLGVEGSWSGNDTIWRTCLDLNRVLLYGRADGTLADTPQRRVVSLVDAVIAGHGDGPLAARPLPLGLLFGGASSAAVDWVGAQLLGYDPTRIPIARESFGRFRWPLTSFGSGDVALLGALGEGLADAVLGARAPLPDVAYPAGWVDAVAARDARAAAGAR